MRCRCLRLLQKYVFAILELLELSWAYLCLSSADLGPKRVPKSGPQREPEPESGPRMILTSAKNAREAIYTGTYLASTIGPEEKNKIWDIIIMQCYYRRITFDGDITGLSGFTKQLVVRVFAQ